MSNLAKQDRRTACETGSEGDVLKDFDASEYGGAPLLGLNGLVVKTHGSSTAKEVCNSIIQCVTFKEQKINEKIKEAIQTGDAGMKRQEVE